MRNNLYLYNLLLDHKFCNYTDVTDCTLGMEPSLAIYLFSYSKNLFFTYPRQFKDNSLIAYSDNFFNICLYLTKHYPHISNLSYNHKNINFKYISQYHTNILNIKYVHGYNKIFDYNQPINMVYNGLTFTLAKVEDVISYCLFLYSKHFYPANLKYASVLACIYKNQIVNNHILINLLKLGCNVKKMFQKALRAFGKLVFFDLDFDFQDCEVQERVEPLLNFCYDS